MVIKKNKKKSAGKTTSMSAIANRLMSMGYIVFIVPESATILINGGCIWTRYFI
jgi:hypothetical protein